MKIINLKNRQEFLPQYVNLRNKYSKVLLTRRVTLTQTKTWLMNTPVEIIGLVRDSTLLGAAVLYLDRSGEIAFFVREKGKGYGSKLLKAIENVAREKGLRKVWARVLKNNHKAIRAFLKNGYKIVKTTREKHVNSTVFLIYFEKKLNLRNSGGFK